MPAFRKITKTATRNLARRVDAQIYHVDDSRRYTTTIGLNLREWYGWVTREIVEDHEAIVAEIAEYGVIGNATRDFSLDERGWSIGNRYGCTHPQVADLYHAKKNGDMQMLADIMAWWSLRFSSRVENLKVTGRW